MTAAKKKKELTIEDLLESANVQESLKDLEFEQGLSLLEELIRRVESGSLPLNSALSSYEKGVALIKALRAQLEGVEKRLIELKEQG